MSAHGVAERAPLVSKAGGDDMDIEGGARASSSDGSMMRWGRALALGAALALAGAAALSTRVVGGDVRSGIDLGVAQPSVHNVRRDRLSSLGKGMTFSDIARGEQSCPTDAQCDRQCVKSRTVDAQEDAKLYFVVKGLYSSAGEKLKSALDQWSQKKKLDSSVFTIDEEKFNVVQTSSVSEGEVDRPYLLPSHGFKKKIEQKGNTSMFYHFIHVPKAGGTNFQNVLTSVQNGLNRRYGSALRQNLLPKQYFSSVYSTAPLIDTTIRGVAVTTHQMMLKDDGAFATDFLSQAYEKGQRIISKGPYSMGICSTTDAPCMYLTVIRDPFERFMSHYKYSCLEGSEGQSMWLPEWKAKGECPLSPYEWAVYTLGDDWTQLIVPGANPRHASCHDEAFMNNIMSGCVRYLLMEKLEDGLRKMKTRLPDFERLDIGVERSSFKNGSNGKLTPKLRERLNKYMEDKVSINEIKKLLEYQTKMYQFAVDNYEKSWNRELETC